MPVVPSNWELPEAILGRFGDSAGRQRAMVHDGHLLLVFHDVPEPGKPERRAILVWREPGGEWRTPEHGGGLGALEDLLLRYEKTVDKIEEAVAKATVSTDYFQILRSSAPVQRSIAHLVQTLQAARDAIPGERKLINFRDRAAEIQRAAELAHGEAHNGLEYEIASNAEMQAKIGHDLSVASGKLNVIAAVFLPLTAMTSIFGMNIASGIPTNAEPLVFWGAVLSGVVIGYVMRGRLRLEG